MVLNKVYISASLRELSFEDLRKCFDSVIRAFAQGDPQSTRPTKHQHAGGTYLITSVSDIATGDEVVVILDNNDLQP